MRALVFIPALAFIPIPRQALANAEDDAWVGFTVSFSLLRISDHYVCTNNMY